MRYFNRDLHRFAIGIAVFPAPYLYGLRSVLGGGSSKCCYSDITLGTINVNILKLYCISVIAVESNCHDTKAWIGVQYNGERLDCTAFYYSERSRIDDHLGGLRHGFQRKHNKEQWKQQY